MKTKIFDSWVLQGKSSGICMEIAGNAVAEPNSTLANFKVDCRVEPWPRDVDSRQLVSRLRRVAPPMNSKINWTSRGQATIERPRLLLRVNLLSTRRVPLYLKKSCKVLKQRLRITNSGLPLLIIRRRSVRENRKSVLRALLCCHLCWQVGVSHIVLLFGHCPFIQRPDYNSGGVR